MLEGVYHRDCLGAKVESVYVLANFFGADIDIWPARRADRAFTWLLPDTSAQQKAFGLCTGAAKAIWPAHRLLRCASARDSLLVVPAHNMAVTLVSLELTYILQMW